MASLTGENMSKLSAKIVLQDTINKSIQNRNVVCIDTSDGILREESIFCFSEGQMKNVGFKSPTMVKLSEQEMNRLANMPVESHSFDEALLNIIEKDYVRGKSVVTKSGTSSSYGFLLQRDFMSVASDARR